MIEKRISVNKEDIIKTVEIKVMLAGFHIARVGGRYLVLTSNKLLPGYSLDSEHDDYDEAIDACREMAIRKIDTACSGAKQLREAGLDLDGYGPEQLLELAEKLSGKKAGE